MPARRSSFPHEILPPHLALRVRPVNEHEPTRVGRAYVLCWLQQALRAEDNPILDVAATLSRELGVPLLVYHGLGCQHPHASWRLHQFVLEASVTLEADLARFGVPLRRVVQLPGASRGLVHRLAERAAVVVTDDQAAFVARSQTEALALQARRTAVWAVDAACAVPMNCFEEQIPGTSRFRREHERLRPEHLGVQEDAGLAACVPYEGPLPFVHDDLAGLDANALRSRIERTGVDMSLPPAPGFSGSRAAALERLAWTVEQVLPAYHRQRGNAAIPEGGSRLSPYLHFGVLGPREVARAVMAADVHDAARAKYLEELLMWREFFHQLARFESRPEAYECLPAAARETLEDHASDERGELYDLDALIHGETRDETWNAAQKQYLFEGYMHNSLRMYWATRLIAWLPTPQAAWSTARYLNDRLSLDGRDPATYGNLQWCFGRTKRAAEEMPVYGWVPRRSDIPIRRREGMSEWLAREGARDGYRIAVPDSVDGAFAARSTE